MADYLASHSTLALDGILYPSVQTSTPGNNVMLFHKASRVELIDYPSLTEIDVTTGYRDEDGWTTSYGVVEILPTPEERGQQEEEEAGAAFGLSETRGPLPSTTSDDDYRETTLRLKLKTYKFIMCRQWTSILLPIQ